MASMITEDCDGSFQNLFVVHHVPVIQLFKN